MVNITKSKSLRAIADMIKQKGIEKKDILSFFQNTEGDYIIMYDYNEPKNGKQA